MTMPKEPAFWSGERWQTRYVDGHWIPFTDAQKPDDALRVAALEAALSDLVQAIEGEHRDGVPVTRSIRLNAMFRAAKAALAGAPWEPSDQMVRRAELAVRLEFAKVQVDAINVARAALKAAMGSDTST